VSCERRVSFDFSFVRVSYYNEACIEVAFDVSVPVSVAVFNALANRNGISGYLTETVGFVQLAAEQIDNVVRLCLSVVPVYVKRPLALARWGFQNYAFVFLVE
jgi:hypothetical protein